MTGWRRTERWLARLSTVAAVAAVIGWIGAVATGSGWWSVALLLITLTDCLAGTSPEEHANAITYDYPMFSKPMTGGDFEVALSGAVVAADASRGY